MCLLPPTDALDLYVPLSAKLIRERQLGLEGSPSTITFGVRNGKLGVGYVKHDDHVELLRNASRALVDVLVELADDL